MANYISFVGITLDPSVTLSANGAEEFYIVRNNSKRVAGLFFLCFMFQA